MSDIIKNNSFFLSPLQRAIKIYGQQVVPRLTPKNKTIGIAAAVAMTLIYLIRDKLLKPPRNLRHIPYQGYYDFIKSIYKNETYWDRAHRWTLPFIDSASSNGLYVRPGRFGYEIHVADPEAAKKVFLKHDLFPKVDMLKGKEGTLNAKFAHGPNLVFLNGSHWKAQRMVANPAFHRAQPIQLFGKLTQDLFERMDRLDETADVHDLMERFTLEAIGRAGFGFEFNAIKDDNSPWVMTYNTVNTAMQEALYFLFPSLDQSLLWLSPKRQAVHRELERFVDMLSEVITKKRQDIASGVQNEHLPDNEKDVLTLLIENEDKGEGALSDEELRSNLHILFLAGHDTTSSALSFALLYLAKYPEIQERAREEIINILGDEPRDIVPNFDDLKQMDYIDQIIKETLRINGPVVHMVPRVAQEDTELAGAFIPKGSIVIVDVFNIQHSKKVWENPDEFDPDRFDPKRGPSQLSGGVMSWAPFGSGARQCIAVNFSFNEQRVLLSMMLRKYTWSLPEDSVHKGKIETMGLDVVGPVNCPLHFKKRY
ncbi:hypothetical protein MBANPS3_009026 [Mucor bainieri]